MSSGLARHLFTVEDFQGMARTGILAEDARVELIEGEVVEMSPIGHRHNGCVNRLTSLCFARLGQTAVVQVQGPLQLSAHTQTQPDVCLLRPRADFYASRLPGPADALLVVEVADTTIESDRG